MNHSNTSVTNDSAHQSGETITIPNGILRDLMVEVLARGEAFQFRARGWSMSPFIKNNDWLTIRPIDQPLRVGQVVAFIQPGSDFIIVHRIQRKDGGAFWIQGDNKPGFSDGRIPRERIIGRVEQVMRHGRRVWYGAGISGWGIVLLSRMKLLTPMVSLLYKLFRGKERSESFPSQG